MSKRKTPKAKLAEAVAARDTALATLEAAQATAQLKQLGIDVSVESYESLMDLRDFVNYQDYIPRGYDIGQPHFVPATTINDRRGGKDAPIIQTEQDLAAARGVARLLCYDGSPALAVLANLISYTLGDGFEYTAQDSPAVRAEKLKKKKAEAAAKREAEQLSPAMPAESEEDQESELLKAVQEIIDETLEAADWTNREAEGVKRTHRDGEVFLRVTRMGGAVKIRIIEPDQIREPSDKRTAEEMALQFGIDMPGDWCFGIHTAKDDVETVFGYWVEWSASDVSEYVPADQIIHIKTPDTDSNVKRGISDFFATQKRIRGAEKLSDNMVSGASLLAAIAWFEEMEAGVTETQAQGLRTNRAEFSRQRTTEFGSRTDYVEHYGPGSIVRGSKKTFKHPAMAQGTAADSFIKILQAALRSIGVRWCMPEYMISGDASNANYSSTLVAESPFVRATVRRQRYFGDKYVKLIWRIVRLAWEAGRLGMMSWEQVKAEVEIVAKYASPEVRDKKIETDRLAVLNSKQILSKETWAAMENLDYDMERANIDANPPVMPIGGPDGEDKKPFQPAESLAELVEDAFQAYAGPAEA